MRVLGLLGVCLALVGCGGSGGGGSDDNRDGGMAFTGFSALPATGEVTLNGTSLTMPLIVAGPATARPAPLGQPTDARATLGQTEGSPTRITIRAGQTALEFNDGRDSTIENGTRFLVAERNDESVFAEFVAPGSVGFEYQTYGDWVTEIVDNRFDIAVLSVGLETQRNALPGGRAVYQGASIGYVTLPTGEIALTNSAINLTTDDFRTIAFASTETELFASNGDTADGLVPDLDLAGTLTVTGGGFSGPVTGGSVFGRVDGRFYGPNAEEAGGVFGANGTNLGYVGSFGAAR